MKFRLRIENEIPGLTLAVVEAVGVVVAEAPNALRQRCQQAAELAVKDGLPGGDDRRQAIRNLLRSGGFKPSGRNKPAQEYLLRTVVQDGALPSINNVVDLINLLSLQAGLPISLVSLDRVGTELSLRYGRSEERYVFNRSGQELDVEGLLCLCAGGEAQSEAVGSPVKDSMKAKVTAEDRHLLACIYATTAAVSRDQLAAFSEDLKDGFLQFCGASEVVGQLLP